MSFYDLTNTSVILNGHLVTGWSDDTDALSMPDVTIANFTRGADGIMTGASTGDKGGPITIKLAPNSPSVQFFSALASLQQNGAATRYDGIIVYHDTGQTVQLIKGYHQNNPSGQTLGKGSFSSKMFVFEFERVIPNDQAANFTTVVNAVGEVL